MNVMLQGGAAHSDEEEGSQNSKEDSQRLGKNIDGVFYPKKERQIDRMGFELTKHALHFRGKDWDFVLQNKRDDLSRNFVKNASMATREPEEHVQNIRFICTRDYLDVKCLIRHKAHTTAQEIQDLLANFHWTDVKSLYEPQKEKTGRTGLSMTGTNTWGRHRSGRSHHASTSMQQAKRLAQELSEFGRAHVGPEGVAFEHGKDMDEEPEALDGMQSRQQSNVFAVGFPS
eukprot:gene3954-2817_t